MSEQGTKNGDEEETSEQPATPSKYGAAELMIGFWFGIGVSLSVVNSLDYCVEALMSSSSNNNGRTNSGTHPKKVQQGTRLAEHNRKKREQWGKDQSEPKLTYYGTGTIVAIGALGILGYYVYQYKKTLKETLVNKTNETTVHQTMKLWFTNPKKLQPISLKWSGL